MAPTVTNTAFLKSIADMLDQESAQYNFKVAPTLPVGRPYPSGRLGREYRMQLINPTNDTTEVFKKRLVDILKSYDNVDNVHFNPVSLHSTKFPSVSFTIDSFPYDVLITRGVNKGETFEQQVVNDLKQYFTRNQINEQYAVLMNKMMKVNPEFREGEIVHVIARQGSTWKESVPLEHLGEVIGDIVLVDSNNRKWYLSLKDSNGDTFSSYGGASTLFDKYGRLDPDSAGADLLRAFGVDINLVQKGYDKRNGKKVVRPQYTKTLPNSGRIKSLFERAWGMNCFYIKRVNNDWKVLWIDRRRLDHLTLSINVTDIKYPTASSKQISIFCRNSHADYIVEFRNSKGGEFPNTVQFKVRRLHAD